MKTNIHSRTNLPITPHRIKLYVFTSKKRGNIGDLIAMTALRGPLTIIAGNEWLPTYQVPKMLRRYTTAVKETLDQVHLARAFTCYQMMDILENTSPIREPLLVINFLYTFYDQNIGLDVRMRILEQCIQVLKTLPISRPVAMLIQRMPKKHKEYEEFYPLLESMAHEIVNVEAQADVAPPIRLF